MAEETQPEVTAEGTSSEDFLAHLDDLEAAYAELAERDAVEATIEEAVTATKKARKAVARRRTRKCDNHPALEAVLVTDRDGRISEQAFCVKCAAKLPANYADAR